MQATSISKVLTRCRFNPKSDPSMKLMVDVQDLNYYIPRMSELCHLAKIEMIQGNKLAVIKHLMDVIKVAVIAILTLETIDESVKKIR